MRILLDTHIALWAIADTSKLTEEVIAVLEQKQNEVYYSVVSVWEVAIKHQLKPEAMPMAEEAFVTLCENTGFTRLQIEADHIFQLKTLVRAQGAPNHKDPFDRLLLAQAKYEGLKLFTHDAQFSYYEETCVVRV